MFLSAYVKDKQTKRYMVLERNYDSKEKFAKDLRANGYSVIRISNRRDIKAQDVGYESVAKLKKELAFFEKHGYVTQIELCRAHLKRIMDIPLN